MPAKKLDVVANFFSKIDREPHSDCWLWKGALRANGYGVFYINRLPVYAHRWSYEYHKGPISEGMVIDHLCGVKHCVNPEHLEVVTQRVNILRSSSSPTTLNSQKTHCPKGHLYDEENTFYHAKGSRQCRECHRIRQREVRIHKPKPDLKTHCPYGHLYRYSNGKRMGCNICIRLRTVKGQYIPVSKVKTHCPCGHPYDKDNTIIKPNGGRECKICKREHNRASYRLTPSAQKKDDRYAPGQWEALKAKYNYTCLCCGKQEPEIKLTADRIVPGCKGGTYNIDNIQPLCGSCNFKKYTKVIDFRPKNP